MHSPTALAFQSPQNSSLQVSLHHFHNSDSPQVDSVAYSNSPTAIALPPPTNTNLESLTIHEVIHHRGSTTALPLPISSPQVTAATISALMASPIPFATAAASTSSASALFSHSNATLSTHVVEKRNRGDESSGIISDEVNSKRMRMDAPQPSQDLPRATPSPCASPLLTHSPLTLSKSVPFNNSSAAVSGHHSHSNSLSDASSASSMHIGLSLMHYSHSETDHDHRDRRKAHTHQVAGDYHEHDHHHLMSSPLTLPTSNGNLTVAHGISLNGVSGSPLVGSQQLAMPLLSPALQATNSPSIMSLTTASMGSSLLSMSTPSVTSGVSNSPTQHPALPPSFLSHPASSAALMHSFAPMSPHSHSVKDDENTDADEQEETNSSRRRRQVSLEPEQETEHDDERQKDDERDGDAGDDEETEGDEDEEDDDTNGESSKKNGRGGNGGDEDTDSDADRDSDSELLASATKKKAKAGKDEKRSSSSSAFDPSRPFGCEFCKKAYVNEKKLRRHLDSSHANKSGNGLWCAYPDCGKRFRVPGKLKRHLQLHVQDKPYKCPEKDCNKSFVYAESLSAHLRIHAGKLPWLCTEDGCGAEFADQAELKVHRKRHKNDDAKPAIDDRPLRTPPGKRSSSRSRDGRETPARSRSRTPKTEAAADNAAGALSISLTSAVAASNPSSASKAKKRRGEKTPPSHPAFGRASTVPPSSAGTSLLHSHPPAAASNFSLPSLGMMLGANQRNSEATTGAQMPYSLPSGSMSMMQSAQGNSLATPAARLTPSQCTVYAHQMYSYCHGFMQQAQAALKSAEDAVKQSVGTDEHNKAQTNCQEAQQRYKSSHEIASFWYQQYQHAAAQAGINGNTPSASSAGSSAGNGGNAAEVSVSS